MDITWRSGPQLSAREVYEVWRIRDLVFSVGQRICDPECDEIDLAADCTHAWLTDPALPDGQLASYLRSYRRADGRHIGRVATRSEVRHRGLSTRLIQAVIERWGHESLVIAAQAHLERWYADFGFVVTGDPYVEADIPHLPMARG